MLTTVDTGDTAWMLVCSALLFLLAPGLALFYGGLGRKKNIPAILLKCLIAESVVVLQWVLFGFSLSFGPDHGGWIGTLAHAGLAGVGIQPALENAGTVPHLAFAFYQMMIATVPPVLILGIYAERLKLSAFWFFTLLWTTLVYDPVAHWIWGAGGFLRGSGALDYAGGIVVQLNTGVAALVAALMLGKRAGDAPERSSQSSPVAAAGAGLAYLGWLGLVGGAARASGGTAATAMMTTHISAAASGLTWAVIEWRLHRRPTLSGVVTGMLAGLVSITACAGFVGVLPAMVIGMGAAILSLAAAAYLKAKLGYEDAPDLLGLHGAAGAWGVIAAGLWASQAINSNTTDGLFSGNPVQLAIQFKAVLSVSIYTFLMTWGLLKLVDGLVGLKASDSARSEI